MGISLRKFVLVITVLFASGYLEVRSADAPSPLTPSEFHEALAFYEGVFTSSHKDRADVHETCGWLPGGRRHIVCNSRRPTSEGIREGLGVYSYDEQRKEYVYHGFGSRGNIMFEHGQRILNGFRFFSEEGVGLDKSQTRFTIVELAGGKVSTLLEESKAGKPWVVVEQIEYVRTRPTPPMPPNTSLERTRER